MSGGMLTVRTVERDAERRTVARLERLRNSERGLHDVDAPVLGARSGSAGLLGLAAGTAAVVLGVLGALRFSPDAPPRAPRSPALGPVDGVPLLLAWYVSHPHWGTEALLVRDDGVARYLLDPPHGGGNPVRTEIRIAPEDMRDLRARLREARPCALRSARRTGRQHESRPVLEISLDGMRCTVALWYEEWRGEVDEARPTAALVSRLRRALRDAGAGAPDATGGRPLTEP
jgi:hypothetical protein